MATSQPEPADTDLINLLIARDGAPTLVSVLEGDTFTVFNIAWGFLSLAVKLRTRQFDSRSVLCGGFNAVEFGTRGRISASA